MADAKQDQKRDRLDDLLAHVARGRIALGVAGLAAPRLATRLTGLGGAPDAGRDFVVRMFGAREIVLGAGYLLADRAGRRTWARYGLLADALDTFSALKTRGGVPAWATAAAVAAAGTCTALGAAKTAEDLLD
ncbi:hypothetical protein Acsp04_47010 [Actinomadura sp. NBRC 104425]|uniref:hypothetical protein n=1 Tax=Actinomadura sp. NBRC 104425 TaxID=3032204 RepID=UPI0024A48F58|nr:hypothetical protein [Actinomadura sp. NBRC 104425]GLZ14466.1 hypothetical protein Acsp04_47010 [Actinomadura sp. NBRC 104425]